MIDRDFAKDKGRTTAAELIEDLRRLPPEVSVFVSGYEGGYHDAALAGEVSLDLNVNIEWYYGPHDDSRGKIPEITGFVISAKTS